MRTALAIARKDLRLRLRDRSAIVAGFIAPLVIALIISAAFGGETVTFDPVYAVVGDSPLVDRFAEEVFSSDIKIQRITEDEARTRASLGDISAAFIFSPTFEEDVTALRTTTLSVVLSPYSSLGATAAEAIAKGFTSRLQTVRLSVAAAVLNGTNRPIDELVDAANIAAEEAEPVETLVGAGGAQGAAYYGPAMAMFFLFFSTAFAARSILSEKMEGTLSRVRASGTSALSILVGKGIPTLGMALSSVTIILGAMALIFGARWGSPAATGLLVISACVAIFGITALVQTLAKSDIQSQSYASMIGIVFALIGGSFIPISELPAVLQQLGPLTPNGRALLAFQELSDFGVGVGAILGDLVYLWVIGLLALSVAARRMVRKIG